MTELKKRKPVFITGGCGYIGSRVAKKLAAKGFGVVVVDKAKPEERKIKFPASIEFRHADLTDKSAAKKALRGAEVVLHLAANIGPISYMFEHQADILAENARIDSIVYPILKDVGASAVIYSSSSMVFQNAASYPYAESDLAKIPPPHNVYGFAKLIGEYFCKAYFSQYKLPYTIIRYHNVYGPGEDSKGSKPGDIHVIPALIEKVVSGQYPLEILGDKNATRPFVFVDDAVDATVEIVTRVISRDRRVLNTDFNIGQEKHYSILELGEAIWRMFGDARPFQYIEVPDSAAWHSAFRREVDCSKIAKTIGWQAKMPFESGLQETAEWVKSKIA